MADGVPTTPTVPVAAGAAGLAAQVDRLVGAAPGAAERAAVELLLALVEQVGRLTSLGALLAATVEADGLWQASGARSFARWLAAASGMTYARARGLVTTGRALRDHLPVTAGDALTGRIGADQAQALARLAPTSDERRAVLAGPAEECGEEFLVERAREMSADSFTRLVRRWAAAADPGADERGYREASDREFLTLGTTTGGVNVAGFLTTEHGATLSAALDAVMVPPAAGDRRTTPQRRAQGLADLARLALDHGLVGTGAAVRPQIACVVDFETLRRAVEAGGARGGAADAAALGGPAGAVRADAGTGDRPGDCRGASFRLAPVADVERFAVTEVLGAGPVPRSVLARLACDSEISRVVFGPDSQVINAGRAERTVSGPRRKAVIARDQTCRYPGCTAPPALGEVHHTEHWARDGGESDVNTGILLCWHHHDLVHRLAIEIRRSPTGGWIFLTRHGTPIVDRR